MSRHNATKSNRDDDATDRAESSSRSVNFGIYWHYQVRVLASNQGATLMSRQRPQQFLLAAVRVDPLVCCPCYQLWNQ